MLRQHGPGTFARLAALALLGLVLAAILGPALQALWQLGPTRLLQARWQPPGAVGLLPFAAGSLTVALGAVLWSLPLATAATLALWAAPPAGWQQLWRGFVRLSLGLPAVIFGLFGLSLWVPLLRTVGIGVGFGPVAAIGVLGAMLLAPEMLLCDETLAQAAERYRVPALALGATPEALARRLWRQILRSHTARVLFWVLGRALGESLAVEMVIGNVASWPWRPGWPTATLTTLLVQNLGQLPPSSAAGQAVAAAGGVIFLASALLMLAPVHVHAPRA